MNSLTKTFMILVMISLVGFTVVSNEEDRDVPLTEAVNTTVNTSDAVSKPAAVSVLNYIDKGTMTATWYGPGFHGRRTASGEVFDQMELTAAHKQLRFGTLLRITNPYNNKSIIVRINDRGPYGRGRDIDLSKGSAEALGLLNVGVMKVKVEEVSLEGINFPIITLN